MRINHTDEERSRIAECLHYDPESGSFTWLVDAARNVKAGRVAGTIGPQGYRFIKLEGRRHAAHRLAWLLATGEWPIGQIDHINGDKADNRICNLRDVTAAINTQNQRRAHSRNKLGLMGVFAFEGKFRSAVELSGKKTYLGTFDTPEAAHAAYLQAKRQLHPGFTA